MKNFCLLSFCIIFFVLPAHAQKKKKNLPIEASVNVPNCVWIDTLGLFADQTEIANIHYLEYCRWVSENNPEKFQATIIDTTVFSEFNKSQDKYVAHYWRYPGFRFFPILGVTKRQVEDFCQWRSMIVNQDIHKNHKKIAKNYTIEINYRLPTEKEWELIAQGKTQNSHGFRELTKREKRLYEDQDRANCKMPSDSSGYITVEKLPLGSKTERMTEYVFAYAPNEYGFYDTIGNVAEMVQEEGIAKGGSWFHTLEESAIKERQIYTKPTAWLGFRCVATVKLTPKEKVGKEK